MSHIYLHVVLISSYIATAVHATIFLQRNHMIMWVVCFVSCIFVSHVLQMSYGAEYTRELRSSIIS